MLFLGEAPSRLVLAGLALVSGGVYVALRGRRES
jgi:drug/metabolite transporter (DMT)-like permease